ncbi:MAG: carboxypeptidase-like regulatory domain-containing protein [Bacteroidia bacterium]
MNRKLYRSSFIFMVAAWFFSGSVIAQDADLVQVSGTVITAEEREAIPYASVRIMNTSRGTISNTDGFFSLPAEAGDTLLFSSVGFKSVQYPVRANAQMKHNIEVKLQWDTLQLREALIYPWPTREQFRQAFLALDIPDDEVEIAMRNMDPQLLNYISSNMQMDGSENHLIYMRKMASSYYYFPGTNPYTSVGGARVPAALTNPVAWYRLFKALRDGDFKREEEWKPEKY